MKIALTYLKYPMCIGTYFEQAFRETEHEVITVCPYTGRWIPWSGGVLLPQKYAIPPDYEIPLEGYSFAEAEELVASHIDLWVSIDAGYHLKGKPARATSVWVATDPHSQNYDEQRKQADLFFNMQRCYMQRGDIWLPYAYSPRWHYPVEAEREHDVMFIGAPHPKRVAILLLMSQEGYKTHYVYGVVFDEARERYAKTRLIFNWSVARDTNARVFEAMAMNRPLVTNYTPDLDLLFTDEMHYMGFGGVDECLEKMDWLLRHPDARKAMAQTAFKAALPHTYNARVKQILGMV